jgi:23S rRNA pseudouridine2604 synthase
VTVSERIRINRFFTEHGVCSRRAADKHVEAGRIKINGVVAKHGDTVGPGDQVLFDGAPVVVPAKRPVVLAYHKPPGVECTSDPRVADNIIEAVGYPERIFHVGRLDKYSEGLILLTNRGELVNQILRVRGNHEKEYIVDVDVPVSDASLRRMRDGLEILGSMTLPCQVERLGARTFRMILTEGRNRQIRRMCEAEDLRVKRLVRVRVMNIALGSLPLGRWRQLRPEELAGLERLIAAAEKRYASQQTLHDVPGARAKGDALGSEDDLEDE